MRVLQVAADVDRLRMDWSREREAGEEDKESESHDDFMGSTGEDQ